MQSWPDWPSRGDERATGAGPMPPVPRKHDPMGQQPARLCAQRERAAVTATPGRWKQRERLVARTRMHMHSHKDRDSERERREGQGGNRGAQKIRARPPGQGCKRVRPWRRWWSLRAHAEGAVVPLGTPVCARCEAYALMTDSPPWYMELMSAWRRIISSCGSAEARSSAASAGAACMFSRNPAATRRWA